MANVLLKLQESLCKVNSKLKFYPYEIDTDPQRLKLLPKWPVSQKRVAHFWSDRKENNFFRWTNSETKYILHVSWLSMNEVDQ